MRTPSVAALAILADPRRFAWFCDLYRITLIDHTVLLWTGAETTVTWNGETFLPNPGIERAKITLRAGLETDSANLTIYPGDQMLGATKLSSALLNGLFDSAVVQIGRGIAASPGTVLADVFWRFSGRVENVSGSGFAARVSLVSSLYKLAQQFPRNVYSPGCSNQLFDGLCGLAAPAFVTTVTISSINVDPLVLNVSGLTRGAFYYRWGKAMFTTGQNAGRVLRIKENGTSEIEFAQPWLAPVAVGDQLAIQPGCDKKRNTCITKFDNIGRFRGQPFIPSPEMAT